MDSCLTEIPRIHREDVQLFSESEAIALANLGRALGDPVRLQILQLLTQREDVCTCEVEEILDLAQSKVSYHLRVLVDAGILVRESRGTWSHYRLRDRRLLDRFRGLAVPASRREAKRKT